MLVEHRGRRPQVHESVYVAPTAVLCGDVRIGAEAFIATGAALFPGATVRSRAEVRIQGVVHVNSTVPDGGTVPIGWVAVGDQVLSPHRHDAIWDIQRELDFPGTVYGEERGENLMARVMRKQSAWLGAHRDDDVL